jgi:hypothetical protein
MVLPRSSPQRHLGRADAAAGGRGLISRLKCNTVGMADIWIASCQPPRTLDVDRQLSGTESGAPDVSDGSIRVHRTARDRPLRWPGRAAASQHLLSFVLLTLMVGTASGPNVGLMALTVNSCAGGDRLQALLNGRISSRESGNPRESRCSSGVNRGQTWPFFRCLWQSLPS